MKITNRYGAPLPILRAILDDEYDKGDSVLSVTQLISPPRIVILQNANADNLEADVMHRVPALLGTAFHKILEKGAKDLNNHVVEERLFTEILGWKISGAVDLQIDNGDGTWTINDYKVTSVYSVMTEKIEWEQQLNCYAYLARMSHNRNVTKLTIVAILRDWQRKQSEISQNYPQSQIVMVDIPLWDFETQEAFIKSRVSAHQEAQKLVDNGGTLPYCTDQERWLRNEVWAVMKEGRKSAVKLYDRKEEAELGREAGGAQHYVEHRPGDYVRCAGDYCMVARWCRQWHESSGNGAGESTGGMPERVVQQDEPAL